MAWMCMVWAAGVTGYVTNLPAGTYDVTYWYHVTLRANGKAQASVSITEGSTTVLNKAVHGTDPIATYDSKLQKRVIRVTVGATAKLGCLSMSLPQLRHTARR